MLRRLSVLALPWILSAFASVQAQDFAGTWTMPTPSGGAITLTLQLDAGGRATGSLSGNGNSFPLQGERQGSGLVGRATIPGGALHFEASQTGDQLTMVLAELDPQGQPNPASRQELHFSRQGVMGGGGPANPFAAAGGAASGDPYLGTFGNDEVSMTIAAQQGGYGGALTVQGQALPFTAQRTGDHLTGSIGSGGTTYIFEARVQGSTLAILSDGQTVTLQRQGAGDGGMGQSAMMAQGPMTQPGSPMGGAGGGAGGNTQLGQLLLSSKWCSFSYSGTSDNSGSGSSHTSQVQFFPDGTAVQTTGGESYSGGNNGSVAGQSSGGQHYYWQVQGNTLQVSADRTQWVPVNLQVSRNSNGYPIVTADGTEYMQCN
jgi:hypothetical protein